MSANTDRYILVKNCWKIFSDLYYALDTSVGIYSVSFPDPIRSIFSVLWPALSLSNMSR
jgi:hypothetical protein